MYPGTRVWRCTQGQGSGDVPRDKGLGMYPGTRVWECTQGQGSAWNLVARFWCVMDLDTGKVYVWVCSIVLMQHFMGVFNSSDAAFYGCVQ